MSNVALVSRSLSCRFVRQAVSHGDHPLVELNPSNMFGTNRDKNFHEFSAQRLVFVQVVSHV